MTGTGAVAAIDLGATSGRVIVGRVGPDTLETETVARFPNTPVRVGDTLHWDILHLWGESLAGMRRREMITVRGQKIQTYGWGDGARTVLLVHGWRGRAMQFAPLVRQLRSAHYRVVAFDAPANGESPGRRTDVRDWLAAIEALQAREGHLHGIVGHSFGAMAALAAVREGVRATNVVTIAGVIDARYLVRGFGRRVGLSPAATAALARNFAHAVFDADDPWPRFDATSGPLPAGTSLLVVHDTDDREVDVSEAHRLHAATGRRSRLVLTSGFGHSRVIGSAAALDATMAMLGGGLEAVTSTAAVSRGVDAGPTEPNAGGHPARTAATRRHVRKVAASRTRRAT